MLIGVLFSGAHTTKILSTVGAAIGPTSNGDPAPPEPASTARPPAGDEIADATNATPTLLIVRTGTLEIEVADLPTAVRTADAAVLRGGGYVSGSNRSATGDERGASATYRIPSAAWTATLDALHGVGSRILGEDIKTDEVSDQVVDLAARISNLRATEAALQAIMAKAARISDVLDVQGQLTDTRGQIERLVADKGHLEDQAAYGSLTMTFRLPPAPGPTASATPARGWDPGADVAHATGKLVRIGQVATSVGIWLGIVGVPLLVAAAILVLVASQLVRLGRWILARRAATFDPIV
jgi:hypothetical protein